MNSPTYSVKSASSRPVKSPSDISFTWLQERSLKPSNHQNKALAYSYLVMPGGILFFLYQFTMMPFCYMKTAKRKKDEIVFHCRPGKVRTDNGTTKWLGGTIQNFIIFPFPQASPFYSLNSRDLPEQNFSLQYQYIMKQSKAENKEKY